MGSLEVLHSGESHNILNYLNFDGDDNDAYESDSSSIINSEDLYDEWSASADSSAAASPAPTHAWNDSLPIFADEAAPAELYFEPHAVIVDSDVISELSYDDHESYDEYDEAGHSEETVVLPSPEGPVLVVFDGEATEDLVNVDEDDSEPAPLEQTLKRTFSDFADVESSDTEDEVEPVHKKSKLEERLSFIILNELSSDKLEAVGRILGQECISRVDGRVDVRLAGIKQSTLLELTEFLQISLRSPTKKSPKGKTTSRRKGRNGKGKPRGAANAKPSSLSIPLPLLDDNSDDEIDVVGL